MPKIKEIYQGTWLRPGGGPERHGVCYYMCNFLESDIGPWQNPGFAGALQAAQIFGQGTAMMNYAKVQNTRNAEQNTQDYHAVAGGLAANRIYRGGLWFGEVGAVVEAPNHEIIIITGPNTADIVYFEPNFGFYKPAVAGGPTNRAALEAEIGRVARPCS